MMSSGKMRSHFHSAPPRSLSVFFLLSGRWTLSVRPRQAMDSRRYLRPYLIVPCRRMRPSVSKLLLSWRQPSYRCGRVDPVFDSAPVLQRNRENRLLPIFHRQCLKRGNLSRGGGFLHGIHIQPDEGTDNGDDKQPGILADPFLSCHCLLSL